MERKDRQNKSFENARIPRVSAFLGLAFAALAVSGCGQSVDKVNIQSVNPSPTRPGYITHTNLQGASFSTPTSASRILGDHMFGGSNVRTFSTSPNFRMTGGIGVD